MNNIKVNVVGPMKSGKSQVVRIIEEATAGMGIVVTEQNDTAQLRAENQSVSGVEAAPGGALADAPCSAKVGSPECSNNTSDEQGILKIGNSFLGIGPMEKLERLRRFFAQP